MPTSNIDSAPWLTQEAYDRLKKELDERSGPGRAEIIDRIEQAREEGDLKENGGYHAAKDEQGRLLVGAASTVGDAGYERAMALAEAPCSLRNCFTRPASSRFSIRLMWPCL